MKKVDRLLAHNPRYAGATRSPWRHENSKDDETLLTFGGKLMDADFVYSIWTDIREQDVPLIIDAKRNAVLAALVGPLVEALDYAWERTYMDRNGAYQFKDGFDLQIVIDAVQEAKEVLAAVENESK